MKKISFVPAILFALAIAIFFAGCSQKKDSAPAGSPVLVAKAMATNVPVEIQPQPIGHVMAFSSVAMHSQINGVLQQIHFKEGSDVKSNALLFTIDPRPMQAALAKDKAQLENAQVQFDREQKLFEQKLVSQDEYDTTKANRDTLAATVQTDELNLNYTEIRAPFDGVTGALQKHEGDVVKSPDDTLLTINRIHPIYVQFAVPERYLPEIKKQMSGHTLKVSASFENMTGEPPQGELTFVDNSVDTATGTIQLKGTFPNEDDVLWPGQFVNVTLTLSELTNAIVVPSQAVQTGQNGQFIYVVKSDETVEQRPVTTGITYDGQTVIVKNLKAGETVVTDGQLRLLPNAKVSVKTAEAVNINSPSK
jgi:multidrug efflux system membrane fusion protein